MECEKGREGYMKTNKIFKLCQKDIEERKIKAQTKIGAEICKGKPVEKYYIKRKNTGLRKGALVKEGEERKFKGKGRGSTLTTERKRLTFRAGRE